MTVAPTSPTPRRRVLIAWNHTDLSASADVGEPPTELLDHLTAALAEHDLDVLTVNAEDNCDRLGDAVVVFRPHIILNLIDHFHGDALLASAVTGLLDVFEFPFVGGDAHSISACHDRLRCHLLLSSAGVPVTPFVAVWSAEELPDLGRLRYPLIISQAFDDIYHEPDHRPVLADLDAARAHAEEIFPEEDPPFLIEEYVGHRRIHVVVAAGDALPPCEIHRHSDGSFDVRPATLESHQSERMQAIALASARTLGCRDWGQVELVMSDAGELFVSDVRAAVPLWQPESCFFVAADADDGSAEVLTRVVRSGLDRALRIDASRRAEEAAANDESASNEELPDDTELAGDAPLEGSAVVEAEITAETTEAGPTAD